MDLIYTIHSHTRWVVAVVVLLAIIKLAITVMRKSEFGGGDRGLLSAAVGMIDLQALFGLILFVMVVKDGFNFANDRYRVEHAVTLILALVAAHMTAKWKKSPSALRARNSLIALLVAALLIFVGVMRLPGNGWTRSLNKPTTPVEVMR